MSDDIPDDFLTEARRNWREQDAEVETVGRRLSLGRRWSDFMLVSESLMGVVAVFVGVAGVWMGLTRPSSVLLIVGLVMLLCVPPLCWLAWRVRRDEPRWQDETPDGVLRQMIAHTRTVERLMRLVRWQGWMMVGLTAVLWAAVPSNYVPGGTRLLVVSTIFLATAASTFAWASWRERGARRERERCERLLAEYR